MLTKLKMTGIEEYGDETKEVTALHFRCPCGNGEIVEEHKKQFKADFTAISILCQQCNERYGVKFNENAKWELIEREK